MEWWNNGAESRRLEERPCAGLEVGGKGRTTRGDGETETPVRSFGPAPVKYAATGGPPLEDFTGQGNARKERVNHRLTRQPRVAKHYGQGFSLRSE